MDASRGDTIIELVLAFAIFSLAAVGTMTVLNNGVSTTQRNLETTLVRAQIDTQGEMIRYIKATNNPAWNSLISSTVTAPRPLSESCLQPAAITQGFYIQPVINSATDPSATSFIRRAITSANYVKPATYAKINYNTGVGAAIVQSQGIWIQATRAQQNGPIAAYDFYIHACWDSLGVNVPMTLGTIVRIYE